MRVIISADQDVAIDCAVIDDGVPTGWFPAVQARLELDLQEGTPIQVRARRCLPNGTAIVFSPALIVEAGARWQCPEQEPYPGLTVWGAEPRVEPGRLWIPAGEVIPQ